MYVFSVQILCEKVNNFFYFSRTAIPYALNFSTTPFNLNCPYLIILLLWVCVLYCLSEYISEYRLVI